MNDTPGSNSGDDDEDRPDDGSGDQPNPFKGTPFEALFGGAQGGMPDLSALFGGTPGQVPDLSKLFGGTPGQMPDLSALFGSAGAGGAGGMDFSQILGQMQAFMKPHDGPVNWEAAIDMARKQAAAKPDPSVTAAQKSQVADAVRLADHWLDEATAFPSGVTTTAAWSRAEWIVGTTDVWKVLVEPVAAQANQSLTSALPEEARAMAGPLIGMLSQASGAMVAGQVGNALGALAGEVLTASDIGLPLGPIGLAALVPANVEAFADGLDSTTEDVLLYLALREAAHQRLFAGASWLREHLIGAVRDYAEGVEINLSSIEEQLKGLDPSNLGSIQEAFQGGLFDMKKSPAQQAALSRLEVTLALVEGWVDEIVSEATEKRMPAATSLQEAVRRRRAAGGPAEQTFASLVGLELRPRRLRDASTLWGSLRTRQGIEARDGVWMHPGLLPTAADLDDPLGFREGASTPDELSADEFDAGLSDLLEGKTGHAPEPPLPGDLPGEDGPGSAPK